MKTQNRSIGATLHNSTENAAFHRVQKIPAWNSSVEPFRFNPAPLTDKFFDNSRRYQNSLVIPNWADELKRRVAQFEPISILAKSLVASAPGQNTTSRRGQPAQPMEFT